MTTRVHRGVPAGGQFTSRGHAAPSINLGGRFAHAITLDQLDAAYEHAISPENLSHDGERPLAEQRRAANELHESYVNRRSQLIQMGEAAGTADSQFTAALDLTTIPDGQSRTVDRSVHSLPGVEELTFTLTDAPAGQKDRRLLKIDYTLTDYEDLDDFTNPAPGDGDLRRIAEEVLANTLDLTDSGSSTHGRPADSVSITGGKAVATHYELMRVGESLDPDDLKDWTEGMAALGVKRNRDAMSSEIHERRDRPYLYEV